MLWWMLQTSVVTAVLIAVVATACRFGRLRPAVQHLLWLAVLVKLATPHVGAWPWSIEKLAAAVHPVAGVNAGETEPLNRAAELPRGDQQAESIGIDPDGLTAPRTFTNEEWRLVQGVFVQENRPAAAGAIPTIGGVEPPARTASADVLSTVAPETPHQHDPWLNAESVSRLMIPIWLCGMGVYVVRQCRRILQFRRKLRSAREIPDWLQQSVRELSIQLGVRTPRLVVARDVASPCLWCLGRPQLVWPERLADDPQPARWQGIIVHELAHLQRRDHWVAWLELAVGCVWWWNPLYWLVRRRLRETADLACDAWAVSLIAGDQRVYAESLLEITAQLSDVPLAAPVLGASLGTRRAYQRRIEMIMSPPVPHRASLFGILCACALAALSAPAWSLDDPAPPSAAAAPAPVTPASRPANAAAPAPVTPAARPAEAVSPGTPDPVNEVTRPTASDQPRNKFVQIDLEPKTNLTKLTDAERLDRLEGLLEKLLQQHADETQQKTVDALRGSTEEAVRRETTYRRLDGKQPPESSEIEVSTASGLSQSLAGSQIDLIRLATEYSDATGQKKIAAVKLQNAEALAAKKVVSNEQVLLSKVDFETASNKVTLLRAIAEATAAATEEELTIAQKMFESGRAGHSGISQSQAKLRVLQLILNTGADKSTERGRLDDDDLTPSESGKRGKAAGF